VGGFRPLKCRDVKRALTTLDFKEQPGGGSSHSQWEKIDEYGHKHKVTVDCHKGEVRAIDVRSIISQAGVTKKQFYDAI